MGMNRAPKSIYRDPRWMVVRLEAKRRDDWRCQRCGAKGRLEVHHIKRVKEHPELAYTLKNLMTLCGACHAKETARETGINPELSPARKEWRELLEKEKLPCLIQ